jgi:hypothetical protein
MSGPIWHFQQEHQIKKTVESWERFYLVLLVSEQRVCELVLQQRNLVSNLVLCGHHEEGERSKRRLSACRGGGSVAANATGCESRQPPPAARA